jgi:hypothetical protein
MNSILQDDLGALKARYKQDKEVLLQHLQGIETNYQKYAFYYTKYLEERVVSAEANA